MSENVTPDSLPSAGKPAFDHPYALFHNADYVRFLIGRLVSTFGQQMFAAFIGLELYQRTGSALALGFVGLTQFIPMFVFTLPAGHVADTYNRKHIILFTTLVMALVNVGLTLISAFHAPVVLVYVCLVIAGSARTFLWAASASFLPQLVERKNFSRAVTFSVSAFQTASILGPMAGGFLVAHLGRFWPVYVVNTITALTFCYLLTRIRQHQVVAAREKFSVKTLLNGFRFVFTTRIILGIITLDMFAVLLGGAVALLPIYATDILKVGPRGLGFLAAAMPLGAIFCAFIMAHRPPMKKAGRSMLLAVAVFGLATIGFGLSHWFWLSLLLLFTCGAVDNVSVVVRQTLVQMLTPDEKRGRVSAVNNLFIGTSNELGEFESGSTTQLFGPILHGVPNTAGAAYIQAMATGAVLSTVVGGVGTILVVFVVAILWPEIRKYGRLDV